MSNQSNFVTQSQAFAPDQTVQTLGRDGEWMFLQDAAEALEVSEKTLRRYVKNRRVKSRRIGKQVNSPLQILVTKEFINAAKADSVDDNVVNIVDAEDADTDDLIVDGQLGNESYAPNGSPDMRQVGLEVDRVIRAITEQFAQKLDEQKEVLFQLRHELHEKDIQLRLLPDLQKQLDEKQKLSEFESTALHKQIDELKADNERLRQESEAAKVASQSKQNWLIRLFSGTKAI